MYKNRGKKSVKIDLQQNTHLEMSGSITTERSPPLLIRVKMWHIFLNCHIVRFPKLNNFGFDHYLDST